MSDSYLRNTQTIRGSMSGNSETAVVFGRPWP